MNGPVSTRVDLRLCGVWGVLVALLAGLLGACGSNEGNDPDDDASGSETASTEAEPYLPVPSGVTLTEPGTSLDYGDGAVVAWEPRQERVGVLQVKVVRAERTTWKAFAGWQLPAKTKKLTPYFAHARVTNVGSTDVGGRAVPLYGFDSDGVLIESSKFDGKFEPCPGNGIFPKGFKPETKQTVCLVYLVEPGRKLKGVSFRPTQEFEQIVWTGGVEEPGDEKKSGKKKSGKKQGG